MTVRISLPPSDSARRISFLWFAQGVFFLMGVLLLGYYGYVQLDTKTYQFHQNSQFEQALKNKEMLGSQAAN